MNYENMTREQLITELAKLRQRNIELEVTLEEVIGCILKGQEELLNLVLETSNTGFWDWNNDTGELYFSPSWSGMLEYPQEELEPHIHTWERLLHPDDFTATMMVLGEHLEGRSEKYEATYRMLSKYREWKWFMARGQVVARNKDGRPLRMVGTCIDITYRKQVELALVQSQEKFSKVFKCNPDLISITTLKEGRYVEVNDAFVEITGYERHEVIGLTIQDLEIWAGPDERDKIIKQAKEHGNVRNIDTKFRMKSGEIRNFELSLEIIDIDGEEHLIITTRDITERKQMEEALRMSEECFSKAFNASPVAMTISTLEEGKYLKVNNAFCCITGYSQAEVIGKTSLDLGIWMDVADRNLVKQRILAKQIAQEMEIGFCTKTGEERRGLYFSESIEIDGELCIISVFTDITELRRLEIEMTRLDRLNLVGEMAASIGHEIRNPMTTVRGYLQILRENEDYIQEMEYFDLMIEELDRANAIISDFLSLAKNKMVDMKPVNLNSIIKKSMPLIQARALSKDHYIKLELTEIPDLLLGHKEIHQLILNLVNNGLEAMSLPGDITIKTFMKADKAVLAIQDQGHGIDHDLLGKLGTPFLTTKEQGTGLGLAVCYRIAAQHNARIDVETGSHGTTFFVSFPNPGLVPCQP